MLPFGGICQAESAGASKHKHTLRWTGWLFKGFEDHYVRHHPEKSIQFEALKDAKKRKSGRWWCEFIDDDDDCCWGEYTHRKPPPRCQLPAEKKIDNHIHSAVIQLMCWNWIRVTAIRTDWGRQHARQGGGLLSSSSSDSPAAAVVRFGAPPPACLAERNGAKWSTVCRWSKAALAIKVIIICSPCPVNFRSNCQEMP